MGDEKINRKELEEILDKCAHRMCGGCKFFKFDGCYNMLAEDAFGYIKALKKECGGWIACDDELPTKWGEYLVSVAKMNRKLEYTVYAGVAQYSEVTKDWTVPDYCRVVAWMELPKPLEGPFALKMYDGN